MNLPAGLISVPILLAALVGVPLFGQDSPPGPDSTLVAVSAVRFWSLAGATRVAVETSGGARYRAESLEDPPRLVVDVPSSRLDIVSKGTHIVKVGDRLLRQIRVAQNDPSRTRIVLDLECPVTYEISQLVNPNRIMIEIRAADAQAGRPVVSLGRAGAERVDTPVPAPKPEPVAPAPSGPEPTRSVKTAAQPPPPELSKPEPMTAVKIAGSSPLKQEQATVIAGRPEGTSPSRKSESPVVKIDAPPPAEPKPAAEAREAIPYSRPAEIPERVASTPSTAPSAPAASAAARKGPAVRSLTRALGLKLETVVLDPGHGGHDQGTTGPSGLLEKDLVLDISQRLGALIEQRLGSKVVYTRENDAFVTLDERTAIANENRADLFLSIHANSSPYSRISGADVFYLNFTASKDALEVAARENAGHDKSIFELRELVQKIALKEKLDESRELASRLQSQLSSSWSKMSPGVRNRAVKKAPFVVLIGASMPSVLVEIGFISNARDEALMKRPDQRQRLAEALFRGIEQYASSFSSSQLARAGNGEEE